jgi:dynein heavy chain
VPHLHYTLDLVDALQLETYGAQPPIELLRQYMDHGGWYDRTNAFRRMDDCLFVAAMGPPGGYNIDGVVIALSD